MYLCDHQGYKFTQCAHIYWNLVLNAYYNICRSLPRAIHTLVAVEFKAALMDFVGHRGTGKQGPLVQSLRCENSVANPLLPSVSDPCQHK